MAKPQYNIAVTGLNAIDSPGPGFSVIRALKEAESFDVRIIGLSYENMEPLIYMKEYVDKTYQMPYPTAGSSVLLERLQYIHSREKLDFLFPNFDAELFNFIGLEKQLEAMSIKMALPTEKQFEARHKVNLYKFGQDNDVLVPKAKTVYSTKDIRDEQDWDFPIVVKGKYYDAKIVHNIEQACDAFNTISMEWGLPIVIQEFVQGTEVNVCGVGDGQGGLIGAVPMRKLFITDKGKAWAGVSIDDEELLDITRKITSKTKWNGPFELEFIKTEDNDYHLLEINPRFPAWCYLTVGVGQNLVEEIVNYKMTGQCKRFNEVKAGKMFIRYSYDMIVDIKYFEQISTKGEL